jgi:hypothetical protein
LRSTIAETSGGEYFLSWIWTRTSPLSAASMRTGPARVVLDLCELRAHEALDRIDGVRRVRDGLSLGDLADEALALVGHRHDRGVRRLPSAFVMTVGFRLP